MLGEKQSFYKLLSANTYPGRGIMVGTTPDGRHAAVAYFIMGRSENSRNRVFEENSSGDLMTAPYDASKVKDPSLIIYSPLRTYENKLIVTNGDQTDTVWEGLAENKTFSQSLATRCFEPDEPNCTPRISAMLTFEEGTFSYEMSILKSIDPGSALCARQTFSYPSVPGTGFFLHTYEGDGTPLPSFAGEPKRVCTENDIDVFCDSLWQSLDKDNKISLYVRYTCLNTGKYERRIINRYTK